jgi:hypothetical protein
MKKQELDYSDIEKLLDGRTVVVGLKGGTNLSGVVRYMSDTVLVLVNEPTSTLDIEDKNIHTIVNADRVDFVQFKTERKKD